MTPLNLSLSLPCLPSTPDTREQLATLLGFQSFPFKFLETHGSMVLRAVRISPDDGVDPLLRPLSMEEVSFTSISQDDPYVVFQHLGSTVPLVPNQSSSSLWHEVLPFPFGLMVASPIASAQLDFFPPEWSEPWREFSYQLQELEKGLAKTEVGCLWITGPQQKPALLLTHYVRKQRMRVGLAPSLHELGEAYGAGTLTPEQLWQTFGTQVGFFHVAMPDISKENQLISVAAAIRSSLNDPGQYVGFRLSQEPLYELQL